MLIVGFLVWVGLVVRYEVCYLPLFTMVASVPGQLLVVFAIAWINLAWFYGVFHLVGVLFSLASPELPSGGSRQNKMSASVAVLYTTCNDFCGEAVMSCLNQDYSHFNVFILDDSTNPEEKERVSRFCGQNADRCTLIRRTSREGFKAGNLNHALSTLSSDFTHFAVVDADEVLPRDFLSKMLPYFALNDKIGYLQANHRYSKTGASGFASALSRGISLHWELFLPARNRYGFVMFYGHGAVIRSDVWKKVGGFPPIVSEDIGFSLKVREQGFHGLFVKDVVAEEAFPKDYHAFLHREIKVVKGSLQFVLESADSMLRSGSVTITEKLDLLASVSILFLPIVFMGFLIVANVVLPLLLASRELSAGVSWNITQWGWMYNSEAFAAKLRDLWTWDFYVVTVVTILAPLAYQLKAAIQSPLRMLRYAAQSTAVFLSIIPSVAWETLSYMMGRRVEFLPTGGLGNARARHISRREAFSLFVGILLVLFAIITRNLALLTVAISFLFHPILLRVGWESHWLQVATLLPFLFFVIVFGSIPFLLIGFSGMITTMMPAHH
jgi:cellulose synthase/poly-beta-1,6-N-acetylglucosamine synthase-like glycosyltransferase